MTGVWGRPHLHRIEDLVSFGNLHGFGESLDDLHSLRFLQQVHRQPFKPSLELPVLNFVRQWGGDIRVESTPGHGSCFEIILPMAKRIVVFWRYPAYMACIRVRQSGS